MSQLRHAHVSQLALAHCRCGLLTRAVLAPTRGQYFTFSTDSSSSSWPISRNLKTRYLFLRQRVVQRSISTESKIFLKRNFSLGGKIGIFLFAASVCVSLLSAGLANVEFESNFPAPPEWTWMSKYFYTNALGREEQSLREMGIVNWPLEGEAYRSLLARLENPNQDGKDVVEQKEYEFFVPNLTVTGLNIERKSEQWRRGYYTVLMACARSAENLDGWVKDKTRPEESMVFPVEVVVGPSNPYPRACPPGAPAAPLEKNCDAAFDAPDTFYLKALTTKGFSRAHRLDAALKYGDWLAHKGNRNGAEEALNWGLDIACSGVADPDAVINKSTLILKSGQSATPNILRAVTALATYRAQLGDISFALPAFLSILRAKRSFSECTEATLPTHEISESPFKNMGLFEELVERIKIFFQTSEFPSSWPTGDETLGASSSDDCDDVTLMTFVGEILFASSQRPVIAEQEAGMRWTREAIEEAEKKIRSPSITPKAQKQCVQCIEVGLGNMVKMASRMAAQEQEIPPKVLSFRSIFWSSLGKREENCNKWPEEYQLWQQRLQQWKNDAVKEMISRNGPGAWLGIV